MRLICSGMNSKTDQTCSEIIYKLPRWHMCSGVTGWMISCLLHMPWGDCPMAFRGVR